MPLYTLNRNHTHRSLMGHTIQFIKGQPAFVPPACEREVLAIGADRVDGIAPEVLDPISPEVPQLSNEDRATRIAAAFTTITESNNPRDFTGQGVPTVKAVEKIVSFDVDRFELAALWGKLKEEAPE
jgi:hypothetical protein